MNMLDGGLELVQRGGTALPVGGLPACPSVTRKLHDQLSNQNRIKQTNIHKVQLKLAVHESYQWKERKRKRVQPTPSEEKACVLLWQITQSRSRLRSSLADARRWAVSPINQPVSYAIPIYSAGGVGSMPSVIKKWVKFSMNNSEWTWTNTRNASISLKNIYHWQFFPLPKRFTDTLVNWTQLYCARFRVVQR